MNNLGQLFLLFFFIYKKRILKAFIFSELFLQYFNNINYFFFMTLNSEINK